MKNAAQMKELSLNSGAQKIADANVEELTPLLEKALEKAANDGYSYLCISPSENASLEIDQALAACKEWLLTKAGLIKMLTENGYGIETYRSVIRITW